MMRQCQKKLRSRATGALSLATLFICISRVAAFVPAGICSNPQPHVHRSFTVEKTSTMSSSSLDEVEPASTPPTSSIFVDYLNSIRPTTCTQAVGALVVGYLALASGHDVSPIQQLMSEKVHVIAASISVYLSYGAGMVMNDVIDVNADSIHDVKSDRAIASGRISARAGWVYCAVLSLVSLLFAYNIGPQYVFWTLSNLAVMFGYALGGLQKVFLVKNILCGWLAISPLVGAALLGDGSSVVAGTDHISTSSKLWRLAAVGFPMHVSREILKDIEDVDIDQGNKSTLPLVVGEHIAHRIAFGIVGSVCTLMIFTHLYWGMFASKYHIYPLGVFIGLPMCIRASFLRLSEGQRLLKKSIYVLLAGMIGGLLTQ